MKKTTVILIISIAVIGLTIGLWTYTQATGSTISICANKTGFVYMVGQGFMSNNCLKNDKLITWNVQGPKGDPGAQGLQGIQGEKGDKGDQGDPGLPAQHGAGNIAFIWGNYLLKTDGTIWVAYLGNVPFTPEPNWPKSVPIPVSDIVAWEHAFLIDKNGNYWFFSTGSPELGWRNFGPLP